MSKVKFPQAVHDFYKSNGSETVVYNTEPSLTRQEFAEECDINTLMKRYEGHGQTINYLMAQPAQGGQYLDFAELPQDLMGYMQFMEKAQTAFMTLPAAVRKEFDNDPIMFCDFASDPENLEQMRSWGLAKRPPEPPAPAPGASNSSPTLPGAGEPAPAPAASPGAATHTST